MLGGGFGLFWDGFEAVLRLSWDDVGVRSVGFELFWAGFSFFGMVLRHDFKLLLGWF